MKLLDGTPLEELGQGLGLIDAQECSECQGQGYHEHDGLESVRCTCDRGMTRFLPCRPCNGTGQYITPTRRLIECRGCIGSGKLERQSGVRCPTCDGLGRYERPTGYKLYLRCAGCRGVGAIATAPTQPALQIPQFFAM